MRMFVAIDLPAEAKAGLAALVSGLDGVRGLEPACLHLTLVFLGEVDRAESEHLIDRLAAVKGRAFGLELHGVGCFGGRRGRPLVLWTGVRDPEGLLAELRMAVVEAVEEAGLDRAFGPFRPHVTVARSRRQSRARLRAWLDEHRDDDFGAFVVRGFTLFSSELHPEGARHQAVFRRDFDALP